MWMQCGTVGTKDSSIVAAPRDEQDHDIDAAVALLEL
jgi:hypothetical protein